MTKQILKIEFFSLVQFVQVLRFFELLILVEFKEAGGNAAYAFGLHLCHSERLRSYFLTEYGHIVDFLLFPTFRCIFLPQVKLCLNL